MLPVLPADEDTTTTETAPGKSRPRAKRLGWTAAALAGAWVIPTLATVVHLDWLLLILMLAATAGVLRAGDALLDRLMFALTMLLGALLALGLVYSVWPWHLDPIGIAGSYLSLVVLFAAISGREFRIPRKVRPTDLVLLAVPAYSFYKLYGPIARLNPIQRFTFNSPLEDQFSHFAYYDAIHRVGGYGFLNSGGTFPMIGHPAEKIYPQGSHFLYVLLDIFTHSSTATGDGVTEYNRFFLYTMLGYVLLVLVTGWAARWIAGPMLRGWHSALVCTTVVCFAAFGPFGFVFRTSDIAEVIGLAFVALLVATVVRAPRRAPDQLLVTAAAVIGVAFAYYAFLLMVLPALLVGAVAYRRRLRRHWRLTAAVGVVSALIAVVPLYIMETTSFDVQSQASAAGTKAAIDRTLLAVLILIVLSSQFTRVGHRSATWRMMSATLLLSVVAVAGVVALQGGSLSHASYYAEKLIYVLFLMCLLGFGSLALFLKKHEIEPGSSTGLGRLQGGLLHRAVGPALALAIAALVTGAVHPGFGTPTVDKPYWLAYWAEGRVRTPDEPVIAALAQRGILLDGVKTLVATSDLGYDDYRLSLLVGDLNHQEADSNLLNAGDFADDLKNINIDAHDPADATALQKDLTVLLGKITPQSGEVRVVVDDALVAAAVNDYAAQHPDLQISVVVLPSQPQPAPAA